MTAAANFAFANRQLITHHIRNAFGRVLSKEPRELGLSVVYDVAHNIAKVERHRLNGGEVTVCVHRKGATRAFPPGHPEVPAKYRAIGQPVLVPGIWAATPTSQWGRRERWRRPGDRPAMGRAGCRAAARPNGC